MLGRRPLLALFVGVLLCGSVSWVQASQDNECRLTILHTNDTHGHLLPFSYPETYAPGSPLGRLPVRHDIGGIARRATLANSIRREPGRQVLLVDAGDLCDGTPFSTEYHGESDVAAVNAAGYDVGCPGNHEFNNSVEQVRKLISLAKFNYVCANVTETASGKRPFPAYVIRRMGPVRVALFGLLTVEAQAYPAGREGLTVGDPIEAARQLVPILRRQADIVVAVTHLGLDVDRLLAVSVDGIDVIVGGHSHSYLRGPLLMGQAPGPEPERVNGTIIAQNFEWGALLGRLDLQLARTSSGRWIVQRYGGKGIPVTSALREDPATSAAVAAYWRPISARFGRRIGTALDDFTHKGPDRAEYNLVADAVRARTGVDIVVENIGGVRAPLVRGPVTYADIVTMEPFSNRIVTMTLTGAHIRQLLAQRRPAVSGMRYVFDGGRVTEATVAGKPLDDAMAYSVATNSFFARDPLFDQAKDRVETADTRLGAIISYVEGKGSVRPSYDGRRVIRGVVDD